MGKDSKVLKASKVLKFVDAVEQYVRDHERKAQSQADLRLRDKLDTMTWCASDLRANCISSGEVTDKNTEKVKVKNIEKVKVKNIVRMLNVIFAKLNERTGRFGFAGNATRKLLAEYKKVTGVRSKLDSNYCEVNYDVVAQQDNKQKQVVEHKEAGGGKPEESEADDQRFFSSYVTLVRGKSRSMHIV